MQTSRRGFITGLGSLFIAAPAIVRAASLMPVSARALDLLPEWQKMVAPNWAALVDVTRQAFVPRLMVQVYAASPLIAEIERCRDEAGFSIGTIELSP